MSKILVVDVSCIIHAQWHIHANDSDIDSTSTHSVARVRSLAGGHDYVVVAADVGKSFRADLYEGYKSGRSAKPEAFRHQYQKTLETLERDGYLVLKAPGYEADDIGAGVVRFARENGHTVVLATSDHDWCQLIGDGVVAYSLARNGTVDADAVKERYGVTPEQMTDYLALMGDKSDAIPGVKGIGEKTAAELLQRYGSVGALVAAAQSDKTDKDTGITPAIRKNLCASVESIKLALSLIRLRDDVPLPYDQICVKREPQSLSSGFATDEGDDMNEPDTDTDLNTVPEMTPPKEPTSQPRAPSDAPEVDAEVLPPAKATKTAESTAMVLAPVEWSAALEPRTFGQARIVAEDMHNSRIFSAWGNKEAALAVILAGREQGLGVFASLSAYHNIEGKPRMSADMLAAVCMRSPLCEHFRPVEITDERATVEVKRRGDPPVRVSYSVADAERAGLVKDKGAWRKNPRQMCLARCKSDAAHAVFPDLVIGTYTVEDFPS